MPPPKGEQERSNLQLLVFDLNFQGSLRMHKVARVLLMCGSDSFNGVRLLLQ